MSRLFPAAVAAMLLAMAGPAALAQEPPALTVHVPARLVPLSPDPEWVEVAVTEHGRIHVDRRSVRAGDGRVRLVARIDFGANRHGLVQSFNAWEIDCARRTWRVAESDLFGEGGVATVSHVNTLEEFPWEPVPEDSPVGALHRDHC